MSKQHESPSVSREDGDVALGETTWVTWESHDRTGWNTAGVTTLHRLPKSRWHLVYRQRLLTRTDVPDGD